MLVNCVAYQDGQKVADIPLAEAGAYRGRPGAFVWVAVREADEAELASLQKQFGLHPLAVEDASHGHESPKVEEYGDSIFVVMHMVEPNGDELRVGEVGIFVGTDYVVSVRRGTERGFQDVRSRCEREPELLRRGPGYVLYALMDVVVDRYFPVLHVLERELDALEERIFSGKSDRASIEALYYFKQKVATLKRATSPLLEAIGRLFGGRVPAICAGLGEYYRDVYDHLVHLDRSLDSARDMVVTAMSVHLSLATMQENETTKRLAAYAALIAVPTLIAGIYGMNFEHIPELKWHLGYPLSLGTMVAIDVWLFWRFRRAGWL
jgi:magnesium transporter